ncbi:hypothetical protein ZWY2020_037096 [Hordeum vulgare]|nr:hypothetical protein ZWY2020_037096 [Hordeum vulgare]
MRCANDLTNAVEVTMGPKLHNVLRYETKEQKKQWLNHRPVVRDLVDDAIVVDENAIVEAMKMCYETLKVAVELRGAIGLVAALSNEFMERYAWH